MRVQQLHGIRRLEGQAARGGLEQSHPQGVQIRAGVDRPDDGQLVLMGQAMAGKPAREFARLGLGRSFAVLGTVFENLCRVLYRLLRRFPAAAAAALGAVRALAAFGAVAVPDGAEYLEVRNFL